jgi:hypothetical protein
MLRRKGGLSLPEKPAGHQVRALNHKNAVGFAKVSPAQLGTEGCQIGDLPMSLLRVLIKPLLHLRTDVLELLFSNQLPHLITEA